MKRFTYLFALLILIITSCSSDDEGQTPNAGGSDFGQITSAVIIVNPVINEGSTTTIKSATQRDSVLITTSGAPNETTDSTGVAVIKGLPTGTNTLEFPTGNTGFDVIQEKELYDVVVSYTDTGVVQIIPPVRYPIGGDVIFVNNATELTNAVSKDNSIVFMNPGIYEGDISIPATDVIIFGYWDQEEGSQSIITGNVTVNGSNVRMRGVTVNGFTTTNGNQFSASFCEFNNANISGNGISLIRNIFNGTDVTVPSGNAVLLDNYNLP
ncbi:hypothetical protein DCC35_11030 [Mangrovivirga cuniculi]|uniref:Uncharacterized protein n=2 Tax=Mangrovivirga cuniculi TaxID=2715131 RepID=A0A4D7JHY2_9BACT|nr:hypothetical protein DCC35_11030 [Mangrovivirga cuniculi]